jgi:hypothetical protein
MSHSVIATVIIPIVVVVLLACWLILVYRADRHPGHGGHPETGERAGPRREVAGGAFRSQGGRQLMPRRDEPAAGQTTTADQATQGYPAPVMAPPRAPPTSAHPLAEGQIGPGNHDRLTGRGGRSRRSACPGGCASR